MTAYSRNKWLLLVIILVLYGCLRFYDIHSVKNENIFGSDVVKDYTPFSSREEPPVLQMEKMPEVLPLDLVGEAKKHEELPMDFGGGAKKHKEFPMDHRGGATKPEVLPMDMGSGATKPEELPMDMGSGATKPEELPMDMGSGATKPEELPMDMGSGATKPEELPMDMGSGATKPEVLPMDMGSGATKPEVLPMDMGSGDAVVIPDDFLSMNKPQLAELYHEYINSLQVLCRKILRLGTLKDGGWEVCNDGNVAPRFGNCLVYSFGINNDFSFDDALVEKYRCTVHSFDPSMGKEDHLHAENVHFHNLGLSSTNSTVKVNGKAWKMSTLQGIRNTLGHSQTKIDILKMDIEKWEWKVIPEMLKSGALQNVTQFAFETHLYDRVQEPTSQQYKETLTILRDLYQAGFRIFWTHKNYWCHFRPKGRVQERTACHEVSMVKVKQT